MPPSKGIRDAQSKETRARLIAVGRELFGRKGFHHTSTNEIVAAATVTRGALYHHFPAKKDLFEAVFQDFRQEVALRIRMAGGVPGQRYGWQYLRWGLRRFINDAIEPTYQRIVLREAPVVLGWEKWRELQADFGLEIVLAALEDGFNSGIVRVQRPEALAHMLLAIVSEASTLIVNAADQARMIQDVETAIDTLLSNMK